MTTFGPSMGMKMNILSDDNEAYCPELDCGFEAEKLIHITIIRKQVTAATTTMAAAIRAITCFQTSNRGRYQRTLKFSLRAGQGAFAKTFHTEGYQKMERSSSDLVKGQEDATTLFAKSFASIG